MRVRASCGVVRYFGKMPSGRDVNPIWKLHAPTTSPSDYPVFKGRTEDATVGRVCSVLLKDFDESLVLVPVEGFRGRYGLSGLIPYFAIGDPRVIRGLRIARLFSMICWTTVSTTSR